MDGYSINELQAFVEQLYKKPISGFVLVPYTFSAAFAALAQNAVQTVPVNINANADFICLGITHRAQIAAAQTVSTKTAPFVRILVTDAGTGEQWTSAAVDLENWSRNGSFQWQFPYPRWVGGRTALTVQATNFAPTAETYTTIDVVFHGMLVRQVTGG